MVLEPWILCVFVWMCVVNSLGLSPRPHFPGPRPLSQNASLGNTPRLQTCRGEKPTNTKCVSHQSSQVSVSNTEEDVMSESRMWCHLESEWSGRNKLNINAYRSTVRNRVMRLKLQNVQNILDPRFLFSPQTIKKSDANRSRIMP